LSTIGKSDKHNTQKELAQKRKDILLKKGKEKKEANLKQNSDTDLSIVDKSDTHNTRSA